MNKKIAVIAGSINPLRQKYLFSWYRDFESVYGNIKLFIGSRTSQASFAKAFKLNSRKEKVIAEIMDAIRFRRLPEPIRNIRPLLNYNPEVIHLLTFQAFRYVEPYLEIKKIKLIVSFRGFDLNVYPHQSESNKELIQKIFKKADKIHFISDGLMRTGISLGADPQKSFVIRRSIWVEPNETIRKKAHGGPLVILSVGRLVWEKGYIYALEAIAILKERGFEFQYRIMGEGRDLPMLQYHLIRLGLEDSVVFLGEGSRNEVKEQLLNADIFFQASVTEALSNALIEASYYGLPIVSSRVGGIPEVVDHQKTGLLSPPCNPQLYANNLARLIDNRELRKEFGINARKRALEYFSMEREIEMWKNIYDEIKN
ncbi:glycosyltransferase [Aequorivita sp. H23M31]|uniref:Glycosyltransferase n=1 Tax=Aequorivita ciconiae TaxID=2494375 RepID=A0A410G253_9FLAO|nr:glycosyltransferase family 4 protein [Aequorivita sp. H23M31]QAA81367.1 glycosyltransferase [Aequorivita sp. H23M31]